ncbi:hypothetical protein COCSUDRAFT_67854 [Coccomyxa subellipsoidea C-169]|uniref:Conserved oligomeric Golgi complex subunit 7 n=1 Tax=Coccomyxa subellipsoidea (strain C-169) TaxID=574566 RepID=I0YLQ9_COCSC|nr:hypothetical protein COCSUDRAFT_67854 [Coccomyxa subellipsoidea C-169]EIE19328.1 hypothetical protein COCSUDRAFT_67854 [Coccomyxa subellipsoidea C-169]|eukprot:XP_005643872.1 hypothetical protein COCSUDRAFT_67854 [Coccomyxa subellipsoidea C-169]
MAAAPDLAAFQEDSFEPKNWINAACDNKPSEESLERFLTDLELRLHLAAEDIDAALEIDSTRALQRIPAAVQEVSHVRGDVTGLKADVSRGLGTVSAAASAATGNVALIVELERVKNRMEAACSTLKEATELSAHFTQVEAVFAEGDLQRIAATLASIRQGLALVGDVPEFKGGAARLQALEERFHQNIEPAVSSALAARQADRVANLAALMSSLGRESELEGLYVAARMPMLQGLWDGFEGRGFASWLPSFYEGVASAVGTESKWCSMALPDLHPRLLLSLLSALFSRINKPFRTRLASALVQGGDKGGDVVMLLASMLEAAHSFVEGLAQTMGQEGATGIGSLPTTVYAPFHAQLDRYGELEAVSLGQDLAAPQIPSATDDAEAAVAAIGAAAAAAEAAVAAAVERCRAATGLAGIPELQLVADEELAQFVSRLQAVLLELRKHHLPAGGAAVTSSDDSTAVLQLLGAAANLVSKLAACEGQLRAALSDLSRLISSVDAGKQALDPVTLRLLDSEGRMLQQLQSHLAAAVLEDYMALPSAAARCAAFQETAQALVYDVLGSLEGLGAQPVWGARGGEGGGAGGGAGGPLPAFSAYPQQAVTAAGEYLMMLPQTLEGLLGGDSEAEEEAVDAEWLDRVAAGAAELYVRELAKIAALSESGAAQLAADLDYFCNVLAALGVAVPLQLVTWQVAVGWEAADFTASAAAALDDLMVDRATLELVAAARGLQMP